MTSHLNSLLKLHGGGSFGGVPRNTTGPDGAQAVARSSPELRGLRYKFPYLYMFWVACVNYLFLERFRYIHDIFGSNPERLRRGFRFCRCLFLYQNVIVTL